MASTTGSIQILDPCPEDIPEHINLSNELPSLKGKTIGLLENSKFHADSFLKELQNVLENEYGADKVIYATKFTFSRPCSEETIDSLIEDCDAIVHGVAD
jgi:hypothetical protein